MADPPTPRDTPEAPDPRAAARQPVLVRCGVKGGVRYVYVDPVHTGHTRRTAKLAFRVAGGCSIELLRVVGYGNGTLTYDPPRAGGRRLDADVRYDQSGGPTTTVTYELWFRGPDGTECQAYGDRLDGYPTEPDGCGFDHPVGARRPPDPPPKVEFP